jgi:hypothetical protein
MRERDLGKSVHVILAPCPALKQVGSFLVIARIEIKR